MRTQILPRACFVRIQGSIDNELEVGGRGRGRRGRRVSVRHGGGGKEFVRAKNGGCGCDTVVEGKLGVGLPATSRCC
jgi:hypothetical protein